MLQQLASQTGQNASTFGPSAGQATGPLASLAQALGAPTQPQPSTSSNPFPYSGSDNYSREPRSADNRHASNSTGRDPRRRSRSPPGRQASGSAWRHSAVPDDNADRGNRRSRSPPNRSGPHAIDTPSQSGTQQEQQQRPQGPPVDAAASLAAWKERNLGGSAGGSGGRNAGSGRPGPDQPNGGVQSQTQQDARIPSFVSDDSAHFGDSRKGKKPAGRDHEAADLSGFQVATSSVAGPAGQEQSANSQAMPQFNPMTFNALDPQSWAGFAMMWQSMFGTMPTNTQLVQWIMMRMQMMGAGPQGPQMQMMGGMQGVPGQQQLQQSSMNMMMGGQQGDFGGTQGLPNQQNMLDNAQSEPRPERPPIPTRPKADGDDAGEADMDVNTDDEG